MIGSTDERKQMCLRCEVKVEGGSNKTTDSRSWYTQEWTQWLQGESDNSRTWSIFFPTPIPNKHNLSSWQRSLSIPFDTVTSCGQHRSTNLKILSIDISLGWVKTTIETRRQTSPPWCELREAKTLIETDIHFVGHWKFFTDAIIVSIESSNRWRIHFANMWTHSKASFHRKPSVECVVCPQNSQCDPK